MARGQRKKRKANYRYASCSGLSVLASIRHLLVHNVLACPRAILKFKLVITVLQFQEHKLFSLTVFSSIVFPLTNIIPHPQRFVYHSSAPLLLASCSFLRLSAKAPFALSKSDAMEVSSSAQIFNDMEDIFNSPSDDEEFLGFQDQAAMDTFSSEDSCDSLNSLESQKKSRKCNVGKAACKDVAPKRGSFGLRVALQFPLKKSVNDASVRIVSESSNAELRLQSNRKRKHPVNAKGTKKMNNESDSENEQTKDNSSALTKRATNIKENKAMLAQLLAELHSMPELFPLKTQKNTPSKPKKTPRRSFMEGEIERRTNPTRSARPPENFGIENFTESAAKFAEHLQKYGNKDLLKRTLSEEEREEHRRRRSSSKYTAVRSVEDITEDELENVAITVKDKIYDKVLGSTCHQCRQKTVDTKTVCRNDGCGGVRGQFCGPCLRNRYGEDVRSALLDPDWICPSCRGICNCSYCRKRDGRCATGMLIHLAKFCGYDNVKEYLESLKKNLAEN